MCLDLEVLHRQEVALLIQSSLYSALFFAFLAVCAMLYLLYYAVNAAVTHSVHQLCTVPLVSMIPMCATSPKVLPTSPELKFSEVVDVQMQIDRVLRSAGAGKGVSIQVMNTGFAVSDLSRRVSVNL